MDRRMPFDRDYYRRFYFNPSTAVTSRAEMSARARLIASCVDYFGLPVSRILDAGCGVGMLRAPLKRALRRADYVGLEYSAYLCQRYGWRQGSIETFRCRERFDLVICYDVLQYLPVPPARRAIANLARLCRGALYFGALTLEDWLENCDQQRTDRIPGLRPGAWYRRELARAFRPVGCGMWLKRELPLTLWNLDAAA
ncbi:MAG: class I SAM-dependent methyltransferase [Steroidobacteraceae bacterium]|jgi:SAM-dependent methyltransferase